MTINTDLLKRWWRSVSNKIWTYHAMLALAYKSLPIEAQTEIYLFILPYLPDWPVVMLAYSVLGYALRLKTKKPISDR